MTELIIYAAIACVVCFMLYIVLGKDSGGPTDPPSFLSVKPSGTAAESGVQPKEYIAPLDPEFSGPAGTGLTAIAQADREFSPKEFLEGAKGAYAMILEGYAEGDKDTLGSLLAAPVLEAYCAAIDAREAKGLTQTTDLARLISSKIIAADKSGKIASISVEFDAELASALTDAEGAVVEGDLDLLSRVTEVWTFERAFVSSDPNWLLVSVAEAGEDTFGSAPDFTPDAS